MIADDQSHASTLAHASSFKPMFPSSNDKGEPSPVGDEAFLTPPTPSSLRCHDTSTVGCDSSYKTIAHGETIDTELLTNGPALRLSTKHIHVTLTTDEILQLMLPSETLSPAGLRIHRYPCCVSVKVTYLLEQEDLGGNIPINAKDLRFDQPTTVNNGAAHSPNELYLSHKTDNIRIKYAIREIDHTGSS